MYKKLKPYLTDDLLFTSILLCCVGLVSFMLGRYSVLEGREPQAATVLLATSPTIQGPVVDAGSSTKSGVTAPPRLDVATQSEMPYVASKSSTKYHLVTCPGAKRIKEENKIFFSTSEEAMAAGYTPAANCPF